MKLQKTSGKPKNQLFWIILEGGFPKSSENIGFLVFWVFFVFLVFLVFPRFFAIWGQNIGFLEVFRNLGLKKLVFPSVFAHNPKQPRENIFFRARIAKNPRENQGFQTKNIKNLGKTHIALLSGQVCYYSFPSFPPALPKKPRNLKSQKKGAPNNSPILLQWGVPARISFLIKGF